MLRLDSTGVVKALLHLHTWMRIVEALQETYSCSAISANSKENCHHSRWKRSSDIIRHHESDSDCQGNWHHRSLGNWLGFFRRCWHGGCCLSEGCSMYKTGCCKHRKGTACSRSLDVMWWSAQRSRLQPTSPHLCSAIPRNMRAKWIDDNWCAVKVQWRVMDWDRDEHKFEWQRPSLLLSASEAAEQWLSRVCDTSYGQHLETEAVVHHFVGNVHGSARLHESDCQWQGQEVFPKYLRILRRYLKHVVIFESMTSTCNAAALQVECIKSSK